MLKVGSPQPQMDAMPPMGDPMMGGDPNAMGDDMGGGMPPMDDPNAMGGDPNMMGDNMGDGSEFDTDFDAGVDADENSDPKKYIQQLTGKLSQSLRKYNENLPQPEADLCKYVAGMILKQTTEGLTDGDKKEIMDKVNGGGDTNDTDDNENDMSSMDDPNMMGNDMGEQPPMMEGINHRSLVNEIFQELTQKRDNYDNISQRPLKNIGFRKKPFTAPSMY